MLFDCLSLSLPHRSGKRRGRRLGYEQCEQRMLLAATTVIDEDFGDAAAFTLNGSTALVNDKLVLTSGLRQAGSAWFDTSVAADKFTATFDFKINQPGGIGFADGFTLAMLDALVDDEHSLGEQGEHLGYGRSAVDNRLSGFAVEFDTYRNTSQGDPAFPHVGVDVAGSVRSTHVSGALPFEIRGTGVISAEVVYDQGNLRVTIWQGTGLHQTVLDVTLLDEVRPVVGRVGFTASTFSGSQKSVIDNFKVTIDPSPRMFALFFTGWMTRTEGSGMEKLRNEIVGDAELDRTVVTDIFGWLFHANGSPYTGADQFRQARRHVNTYLHEQGYDPAQDRIILIGHSYGGNTAWRMASDVQSDVDGRDPAEALITLDPIDWEHCALDTFGAGCDQSDHSHATPRGVARGNILNFVQRRNVPMGYTIVGARNDDEIGAGQDGVWGTGDDTKHNLIDDDIGKNGARLGVYDAIIEFLLSV